MSHITLSIRYIVYLFDDGRSLNSESRSKSRLFKETVGLCTSSLVVFPSQSQQLLYDTQELSLSFSSANVKENVS